MMKSCWAIFFLLMSTLLSAKESQGKIVVSISQPSVDGKDYYENDSLKMSFYWNGSTWSGNLYFALENKLSERVYIEWENARTNGDRVILGNDSRLTYKNKKEDEAVAARSKSIPQCFFRTAAYGPINGWADYVWRVGYLSLKKVGDSFVEFLIPVRFPDGKAIDYKFNVNVRYINTADISQIKEGMKEKDVKKIIGSPDDKKKDKESDTETWYYTHNTTITLVKGIVTNIKKLDQ